MLINVVPQHATLNSVIISCDLTINKAFVESTVFMWKKAFQVSSKCVRTKNHQLDFYSNVRDIDFKFHFMYAEYKFTN